MFTASVALAVGAIPEGLPAAVTITLAIGVNRMARRRGVIRRMPAVETLGSTTVVCSDKTGTLTENQMTVRAVWADGEQFDVTGSGYQPEGEVLAGGDAADLGASEALRWTLIAGAACNDARLTQTDYGWEVLGDPTEGAMLVSATKAGHDRQHLAEALPRVGRDPVQLRAQVHGHAASRRRRRLRGVGEGSGRAGARHVQHPHDRRRGTLQASMALASSPRRRPSRTTDYGSWPRPRPVSSNRPSSTSSRCAVRSR